MKKLSTTLGVALFAITSAFGQWTSPDTGIPIVPEGTSMYNDELVTGADGTSYFIYYHPNIEKAEDEFDTDNVVYEYRLQSIDKEGVRRFGEEGILISKYPNRSYCVYNNYLHIDSEGNVVCVVSDARDCEDGDTYMSAYAYKISPEGEMLWDSEGIRLDCESEIISGMKILEISDGSYVFAWIRAINGYHTEVGLQRLSNDGEPQWDSEEMNLASEDMVYNYPYLVDAGMGQFILVFAKGGAQDLYARKMDFDGTPVWSEDARIYRGGWGSIPIWTILNVKPSGDGGVIVGWNDDRTFSNVESAYISYVTGDGKVAFLGASDEGDVKLTYDGWKAFNCVVMPDPAGDGFLAFWRETDGNQYYQRLMIQKVSKEGELLYGDEGKMLFDFEPTAFGYLSLQPGEDGEAAAFYMRNNTYYGDVSIFCTIFKTETGELVNEEPIEVVSTVCNRSSLKTQVCMGEKFWLAIWEDEYKNEEQMNEERHMVQRINFDGTNYSGISRLSINNENSAIAYNKGQFHINMAASGKATVEIFDLAGNKIAKAFAGTLTEGRNTIAWDYAPGLYIARLTTDNQTVSQKVLIK